MDAALHAHTPTLTAVDPRGELARSVAYLRTTAQDDPTALVSRRLTKPGMRWQAQQDPRLGAASRARAEPLCNQSTLHSLSGLSLRSDSADAGRQVHLYLDNELLRLSWNACGTRRLMTYDDLGRPHAVVEHAAASTEQCVERFTYGGPDASIDNACGQCLRHDDPAGSVMSGPFALSGTATRETRRFLLATDTPDWPDDIAARDALLEANNHTTTWRFDAGDTVIEQIDAGGNRVMSEFHVDGSLARKSLKLAASDDERVTLQHIVYDALGNARSHTAGNGVVTDTSYRIEDGRLIARLAKKPGGTALQSLHYEFDPVGNVVRIIDDLVAPQYHRNRRMDGVSTFTYDTMYRLASATGLESAKPGFGPDLPAPGDDTLLSPYTQTYTYDTGGNLVRLQHAGATPFSRAMAVSPSSNRALLHEAGGPVPDIDAGFDGNGNQLVLEPGQAMHWNLRNQLARVVMVTRLGATDDDEQYIYDGDGNRVRKITRRQASRVDHVTDVRYLPGLEIRTHSATSEILHVISDAHAARVMHWVSEPPVQMDNDAIRYCLADRLGSHACEVDEAANVTSRERFYPFGGTSWQAGRHDVEVKYRTLRYAGKERDASGLYYYGARYYAPWLQRWIAPDPAGDADGLNRFAMVRNNPVTLIDRNGFAGEPPEWSLGRVMALTVFMVTIVAISIYVGMQSGYNNARRTARRQTPGARPPGPRKNRSATSNLRYRVGLQDTFTPTADATPGPGMRTGDIRRRDSNTSATGSVQDDSRRESTMSTRSQTSVGTQSSHVSGLSTFSLDQKHDAAQSWDTSRAQYKRMAADLPTSEIASQKHPQPVEQRHALLPLDLWGIVFSPKFEKQTSPQNMRKAPVGLETTLADYMDSLVRGETPGKLENVKGILTGHDAYFAADITGLGSKGRGKWRLLYTRDPASRTVSIHGIGNHHKQHGGMKPPDWWKA